jgi:hypothetical protein
MTTRNCTRSSWTEFGYRPIDVLFRSLLLVVEPVIANTTMKQALDPAGRQEALYWYQWCWWQQWQSHFAASLSSTVSANASEDSARLAWLGVALVVMVVLGGQAVYQKRVRLFEQRLQQQRAFATLAAAAEYNDDDSDNDDSDSRSVYRADTDNDVINEESEGRFVSLGGSNSETVPSDSTVHLEYQHRDVYTS